MSEKQTVGKVALDLNDIGVQKMQSHDMAGAILKFREALAVDSGCLKATHNLGKCLILLRQYAEAERILTEGLKHAPADPGCLVQLAQCTALQGRTAAFGSWLDAIAGLSDASIVRELPVLLLRQGSLEEARIAADRALQLQANNAVCHFNRGLVAEQQHVYREAEKFYSRAVELNDRHCGAWVNLGNALEKLGEDARAFNAYKRAYAIDPANNAVQYNYGRRLVQDGADVKVGVELLFKAAKGQDAEAAAAARVFIKRLAELTDKGGVK